MLQEPLLQVFTALQKGINPKSPHFLCTKLVREESDQLESGPAHKQQVRRQWLVCSGSHYSKAVSSTGEVFGEEKERRKGNDEIKRVRPRNTTGSAAKQCIGKSLTVIQHCQGCSTKAPGH